LEGYREKLWQLFEYRYTPPDTIMNALRGMADRYMRVVQWVNYCQDSCALDLDSPPFFVPDVMEGSWVTLHQKFKDDFAVLCDRPGFQSLQHFRAHKMPADRAPSPPTSLGERGRALDLSLRQRSEVETKFLLLLSPDAENYGEPGPVALPNAVYRAGEELAGKGVFATREIERHLILFTVPDHIAPFLKRHLFPQSEMKREIRLRLDRVFGSGGGGSGIPVGGGIHR
jgi:hypothetical protein